MFTAAKDALTSKSAQTWANNLINRYGRIEGLRIDSRNKTLEATCTLQGEASPITVKIGRYEVETEGGKKFLRGSDFICTRPWLQNFLNDHADRRLELPSWAAAAL